MTVLLALSLLVLPLHAHRHHARGLDLVICGADGPYVVTMPGETPATASRPDCCLGLCTALALAPGAGTLAQHARRVARTARRRGRACRASRGPGCYRARAPPVV